MYNYYKETLLWLICNKHRKKINQIYTQTWRWMTMNKWLMWLWAETTRDRVIYIMNKYVLNPKCHRKCPQKITSVFSNCASFCIVSFSSCFRIKVSVNESSRLKLRTYPSQLQQKKKKKEERFLLEIVILVFIVPHHSISHLQANLTPHPDPPNDQYYSQ